MSGSLRRFDVVWKYYGGQRFHVYLGKDAKSTGFTLDTWIYFNQLATVHNIEIDLNQVASNGATSNLWPAMQLSAWQVAVHHEPVGQPSLE